MLKFEMDIKVSKDEDLLNRLMWLILLLVLDIGPMICSVRAPLPTVTLKLNHRLTDLFVDLISSCHVRQIFLS